MDEEERLNLEARLAAIEYMLAHTLSRLYDLAGVTNESLDAFDEQAMAMMSKWTVPNDNPAMADHVVGTMQEHILSIHKDTRHMFDQIQARKKSS
jgi:hypothetical protein